MNTSLLQKVRDRIDPTHFGYECYFRDLGHMCDEGNCGDFSAWVLWVAGEETNHCIGNYEFDPSWDNSAMYREMNGVACEVLSIERSSETFKLLNDCRSYGELVKAIDLLLATASLGPCTVAA